MANPPSPRYELYKDKKGEWRWTYIARNGLKIAMSSEGYKAKADCTHSIDLLKASKDVPVHDATA